MICRRTALPAVLLFAGAAFGSGCYPYNNFSGEFYAGPVNPAKFGSEYLGGGDAKMLGGVFTQTAVFSNGKGAGYLFFSVPKSPLTDDPIDPTVLRDDTVEGSPYASPLAYVFDPAPPKAFPDPGKSKCVAPKDYVYDAKRDAVRFDEQGNIFVELPGSSDDFGYAYTPVVAQVPVTSISEPCQEIKSYEAVVTRTDIMVPTKPPVQPAPPEAKPTGVSDGNYLAWAIIDPSADVPFFDGSHDPVSGLGPQKWGYYNHYLVAYLDGGYIPIDHVMTTPAMNGGEDLLTIIAKEQKLYVPTSFFDETGMAVVDNKDGKPGTGHDVTEHKRGEVGYSPICHVYTFDPTDPKNLATQVQDIDPSATTDTMSYVYCLQVEE